jgi:hypothetical protein
VINKPLKSLYNDVFQKISSHIENENEGVLHKIIHIILENERGKAKFICDYCDISPYNSLKDDQNVIDGLIFFNHKILEQFDPIKFVGNLVNSETHYSEKKEKEMDLFWITVIACTLVGAYSCKKYVDNIKEEKTKQVRGGKARGIQTATKAEYLVTQTPPSSPISTDLCLIVPASIASKFINSHYLTADDITYLIDSASYFLCTRVEDAESNEQNLILMRNEAILSDSKREVYIRINIPNGGNMLGQKMPYYLKTNFPENVQCTVKELSCIRDLSGLEKFNRI